MKIYFDMDGVLVNFSSRCPDNKDLNHPSKDLSLEKRAEKKLFWQKIEKQPNFWRDIPVMDNIEYLLSEAFNIGEIFVLSKTPSAKHFIGGQKYVDFVADEKRKWIANNLSKFFDAKHVIICDGAKGALIHPTDNHILVDDRQENINEWISCGGRAILFKNAKDAVYILKNMVNKNLSR